MCPLHNTRYGLTILQVQCMHVITAYIEACACFCAAPTCLTVGVGWHPILLSAWLNGSFWFVWEAQTVAPCAAWSVHSMTYLLQRTKMLSSLTSYTHIIFKMALHRKRQKFHYHKFMKLTCMHACMVNILVPQCPTFLLILLGYATCKPFHIGVWGQSD